MDDGSKVRNALVAYWYLPVLSGILALVMGAVAGVARDPVYTSSATLSVGTSSIGTSGELGGFAESGPNLAATYARAVEATDVIEPIAEATGETTAQVRRQVSGTNVPGTAIVRIDATGSSPRQSIELANAAAQSLTDYVGAQATSSQGGDRIIRRYVAARETLREAESGSDPAAVAAAQLEVDTLAEAYRRSQEGVGINNPITLLSEAFDVTSDATPRTALLAVTGMVGGVIVGSAMAIFLGLRRRG